MIKITIEITGGHLDEVVNPRRTKAIKGDIIRIINRNDIHEPYEIGDVFEVASRWTCIDDDCGVTTTNGVELYDSEYEVIRWSE